MDAEAEAAMLEQNLQDKEESYQREIEKLKEHMEMQRVWWNTQTLSTVKSIFLPKVFIFLH